jgi:REP element-mobilizing transposase RayT
MPRPGYRWRHVIVSTYRSWLPGDQRGFRSRKHKIHSSGDYKEPPPLEEHAGLRSFHAKGGSKVVIPSDLKELIGRQILAKSEKLELRVNAASVSPTHSHWLLELPEDRKEAKRLIGEIKAIAGQAVRKLIPCGIWARGAKLVAVETPRHQKNVYRYILDQEDAWVWGIAEQAPP